MPRLSTKKVFGFFVTFFLLLICVSCQKNSARIKGRWASLQGGAIYEFSKKTFTLNTSVLNSAIMVKGTYRCTKNFLITKAAELSFDFGETWERNDGSLISSNEIDHAIIFLTPEKVVISDVEYVKF